MFEITSNNDIWITRGDSASLTVNLQYKETKTESSKKYIQQNGDKLIFTVKDNADTEDTVFQIENTCVLNEYTKWKDYYNGEQTHLGNGEAKIYLGKFDGKTIYNFTRIPMIGINPKILISDENDILLNMLNPEIKYANTTDDRYYYTELDLSNFISSYNVYLWYDTSYYIPTQQSILSVIQSGLKIYASSSDFQTFEILPKHTKTLGYDSYKYDIQLIVKGIENDSIYTVVPYKNFKVCPEITW